MEPAKSGEILSCAERVSAELGAGGDGPQRRLFSKAGVGGVWPAPQLLRYASIEPFAVAEQTTLNS